MDKPIVPQSHPMPGLRGQASPALTAASSLHLDPKPHLLPPSGYSFVLPHFPWCSPPCLSPGLSLCSVSCPALGKYLRVNSGCASRVSEMQLGWNRCSEPSSAAGRCVCSALPPPGHQGVWPWTEITTAAVTKHYPLLPLSRVGSLTASRSLSVCHWLVSGYGDLSMRYEQDLQQLESPGHRSYEGNESGQYLSIGLHLLLSVSAVTS